MSYFLNSILVLAIASGIVSSILCGSEALKRYISYFLSLIMLVVLLTPLFKIFSSFDSIKEYIKDFSHSIKTEEIIDNSNTLIVNTTSERVCEGIKELVITKFGFDENDVYITLELDEYDISTIKIRCVNVVLTNKASWSDTDKVKEYLDKTVGCQINVTRR